MQVVNAEGRAIGRYKVSFGLAVLLRRNRRREKRSARCPCYVPDLSSQHEYVRADYDLRRGVHSGLSGLGLRRTGPVGLRDARHAGARAAGAVQPCASRRRLGRGLPLLPHHGRDFELRQHSAHQDLHELPFADLEHEPHAGTGARQFPHRTNRSSGRASTICRISSISITAFTSTRASAARAATAGWTACRSPGRRTRCRWSGASTVTAIPRST